MPPKKPKTGPSVECDHEHEAQVYAKSGEWTWHFSACIPCVFKQLQDLPAPAGFTKMHLQVKTANFTVYNEMTVERVPMAFLSGKSLGGLLDFLEYQEKREKKPE